MHDALSRTLRRIGRENAEEYKDVGKVSIVEVNTTDAFSDVLVQIFALRLIERGTRIAYCERPSEILAAHRFNQP